MTDFSPIPDWFDRRRFVIDRPADSRDWNNWGVRDLAHNILVINGVSGEESGLYADTLEEKYNRAPDRQKENDNE
jgi:hypothetical protein